MTPSTPLSRSITSALRRYTGNGKLTTAHLALHPDPALTGVWAVRVTQQRDTEDFLVTVRRVDGNLIATVEDEVEFASWPPTSSYFND